MSDSAFDPIDRSPEFADPASQRERSEYLGPSAAPQRIRVMALVLCAAAVALLVRAGGTQIIRGGVLAAAAEQNRSREDTLVPIRGAIVDRNGTPLVRNILRYAIGIVPANLGGTYGAPAIDALAASLSIPTGELRDLLAQYHPNLAEPLVVRDRLSYDAAISFFLRANSPAVRVLVQEQRDYRGPNGRDLESLSHVVGSVGRISAAEYRALVTRRYRPSDAIGKTGVESSYEELLRGRPGIRQLTVDVRGRIVATRAVESPVAGASLTMTIDRRLQDVAERAVMAAARAVGSRRGAAVVLDPDTGEIVALVSLPAFPSSALAAGVSESEYHALISDPNRPLFPRAIAGVYPSGSTIKPMLAAAALSDGVIGPRTRMLSVGGLAVEGSFFPDWRAGGHGWVDVREAIAQSVNTFFYLIGGGKPRAAPPSMPGPSQEQALGPDGIARGLTSFGFGQPTGIDIVGEASGLVPTPSWKQQHQQRAWYIGDTYHLAIGQGDLLITPLQLAVATAAFANGGYRVTPHLVKTREKTPDVEEERSDGSTSGVGAAVPDVEEPASGVEFAPTGASGEPTRIPNITDEAIQVVRQGMRLAVTAGSAQGLADLPFSVSGKTGTAQHVPGKRPHAWFTGYAEARSAKLQATSPRKVVVTVLVEEGGEGSRVAVPVAREIFSAWAQ